MIHRCRSGRSEAERPRRPGRGVDEESTRIFWRSGGERRLLDAMHPDSLRQAAHSARELIDQVLKDGVSDEEIRSQPGFQPDLSSSSGINRRMRLKLLMRKHRGHLSDSELKVVEQAGDFVLATDVKLMAAAHSRSAPAHAEVLDSLEIAEKMLRRLLVPPSAT